MGPPACKISTFHNVLKPKMLWMASDINVLFCKFRPTKSIHNRFLYSHICDRISIFILTSLHIVAHLWDNDITLFLQFYNSGPVPTTGHSNYVEDVFFSDNIYTWRSYLHRNCIIVLLQNFTAMWCSITAILQYLFTIVEYSIRNQP